MSFYYTPSSHDEGSIFRKRILSYGPESAVSSFWPSKFMLENYRSQRQYSAELPKSPPLRSSVWKFHCILWWCMGPSWNNRNKCLYVTAQFTVPTPDRKVRLPAILTEGFLWFSSVCRGEFRYSTLKFLLPNPYLLFMIILPSHLMPYETISLNNIGSDVFIPTQLEGRVTPSSQNVWNKVKQIFNYTR
jgi:hypothetical protein